MIGIMKVGITDDRETIELSEVYNGIAIKTKAGTFAFCMRDGGIEIRLGDGPWYGWYDPNGPATLAADPAGKHADLLEAAWGIIANAYCGREGWSAAAPDWQEAAKQWRDEYHASLPPAKRGADEPDTPATEPDKEEA